MNAQVVLNEVAFGGFLGDFVELKNLGPVPVDVSGYYLYSEAPAGTPASVQLTELNLICGSLIMEPGDIIAFDDISDFVSWQPDLGDLALFSTNADFNSADFILDYVAWGTAPAMTFTVIAADMAGEWNVGNFVDGNWNGLSLEYTGTGNQPADWPFNNMPTICAENASVGTNCDVTAGTPNLLQLEFCVGDGIPDVPTDLTISGNTGSFFQWVLTDVTGVIQELPASLNDIDFETAAEELCVLWHVAYEDNVTGLEIGGAVLMLGGCNEVSDAVLVSKTMVDGGELVGGPFDFCVNDGVPDFVSGITFSGDLSINNQWIITDENLNILGLPNDPSEVDFDQAAPGQCLIWNIGYSGTITGLEVDANAADLEGCFALSNPIEVNRFGPNSPGCGGGTGGGTDYVLIGFKDLKLERAFVLDGGIGVTKESADLEITEESEVIADGTFVRGPYVRVYDRAKASNIHAIVADPELPDYLENDFDTTDDQDVEVEENETIVLTDFLYDDIEIEDGATVTFSGNEFVYIEELKTGDNVTILFDQCTNLIIDDNVSIGKNNNFNPGEEHVFMFADEDVSIKEGTFYYGGIYTLEKLRIRKAEEDNPTIMVGIFIGADVKARDYVELYYADISPCIPNIVNNDPQERSEQEEEDVKALLGNIELMVYPNPAKDMAYLKVASEEVQNIQIQLFDMMNQVVYENADYSSDGDIIKIEVADLPVGLYTVRITLADGNSLSQKVMVAR
ncbi:MAG: T9SS type A sorting domain-containing protein [Saprospiraceae bacterium]